MNSLIQRFTRSTADIVIMRSTLIFIFVLYGTYKWFDFEVQALEPLISVTWLNILYNMFGVAGGSYFLGVIETLTFLLLAAGVYRPAAGIAGAALVIITGVVTLSLLPQLGKVDGFIVKDVFLISTGLAVLKHDLCRWTAVAELRIKDQV